MASTIEELVSVFEGAENSEDVVFFEEQMLDNVDFNPASSASKRSLERYGNAVSRAFVVPIVAYLGAAEYARLSNLSKASVVRDVMEPGVLDAYGMLADTTRRFYNSLFDYRNVPQRAVPSVIDMERLEAVTANVIGNTLDNTNIPRSQRLASGAYDNNILNARRDTATLTALQHEGGVITAHREVRSSNPCDYCRWQDGAQVVRYRIGDDVNKFHDHCSCEIVIYVD